MTVALRARLPGAAAVLIGAALALAGFSLSEVPGDGRILAFSLASGALFGLVLQRSRFCFYCVTRDYLQVRDARGLLGIVTALALGTIGYHAVFGAFLPVPQGGQLPAGAHIGPVSWVLVLGAAVFGLGMAVSGSCISAHLYRLGEGSLASVLALLGAVAGFGLGFASWNFLYLQAIQAAPVWWLPHYLGYGGSLLLQVAVLAAVAAWLLRRHRQPGIAAAGSMRSRRLSEMFFDARWPGFAGGALVAGIGVLAYLRVAPLGVTAELGSLARTLGAAQGWLPARLEGLDTFAGCATAVKETLLSRNGVFVGGLVLASLASALAAGEFRPRLPSAGQAVRAVLGGVLMGWGALVALGCTVGTLLSGIMAAAGSGWVFALACGGGLWVGWRLLASRAD